MKPPPIALLAACLALTGCVQTFKAKGVIASDGGILGTWHSTPMGCTRDPFDGQPASETTSVITFVWQDPATYDPLRGPHHLSAPDAPMRLELAHEPTGYAINLETVKTQGTRLDATICSTLMVDTHETPKTLPEGQPTLSGSIHLDCRVPPSGNLLRQRSSRLTADVSFQRCEF